MTDPTHAHKPVLTLVLALVLVAPAAMLPSTDHDRQPPFHLSITEHEAATTSAEPIAPSAAAFDAQKIIQVDVPNWRITGQRINLKKRLQRLLQERGAADPETHLHLLYAERSGNHVTIRLGGGSAGSTNVTHSRHQRYQSLYATPIMPVADIVLDTAPLPDDDTPTRLPASSRLHYHRIPVRAVQDHPELYDELLSLIRPESLPPAMGPKEALQRPAVGMIAAWSNFDQFDEVLDRVIGQLLQTDAKQGQNIQVHFQLGACSLGGGTAMPNIYLARACIENKMQGYPPEMWDVSLLGVLPWRNAGSNDPRVHRNAYAALLCLLDIHRAAIKGENLEIPLPHHDDPVVIEPRHFFDHIWLISPYLSDGTERSSKESIKEATAWLLNLTSDKVLGPLIQRVFANSDEGDNIPLVLDVETGTKEPAFLKSLNARSIHLGRGPMRVALALKAAGEGIEHAFLDQGPEPDEEELEELANQALRPVSAITAELQQIRVRRAEFTSWADADGKIARTKVNEVIEAHQAETTEAENNIRRAARTSFAQLQQDAVQLLGRALSGRPGHLHQVHASLVHLKNHVAELARATKKTRLARAEQEKRRATREMTAKGAAFTKASHKNGIPFRSPFRGPLTNYQEAVYRATNTHLELVVAEAIHDGLVELAASVESRIKLAERNMDLLQDLRSRFDQLRAEAWSEVRDHEELIAGPGDVDRLYEHFRNRLKIEPGKSLEGLNVVHAITPLDMEAVTDAVLGEFLDRFEGVVQIGALEWTALLKEGTRAADNYWTELRDKTPRALRINEALLPEGILKDRYAIVVPTGDPLASRLSDTQDDVAEWQDPDRVVCVRGTRGIPVHLLSDLRRLRRAYEQAAARGDIDDTIVLESVLAPQRGRLRVLAAAFCAGLFWGARGSKHFWVAGRLVGAEQDQVYAAGTEELLQKFGDDRALCERVTAELARVREAKGDEAYWDDLVTGWAALDVPDRSRSQLYPLIASYVAEVLGRGFDEFERAVRALEVANASHPGVHGQRESGAEDEDDDSAASGTTGPGDGGDGTGAGSGLTRRAAGRPTLEDGRVEGVTSEEL